jgi:hypothetical protein
MFTYEKNIKFIYTNKKFTIMLENDMKKSVLSEDEILLLREKFISEYAKKKGWNSKELTSTQMLEIATQKEYKNPGLILG